MYKYFNLNIIFKDVLTNNVSYQAIQEQIQYDENEDYMYLFLFKRIPLSNQRRNVIIRLSAEYCMYIGTFK